MNLHEIISRHESLPIHENEMKYVVTHFIKTKTNKDVSINLNKRNNLFDAIDPNGFYFKQVNKLTVAFAIACKELRGKL